MRDTWTKAKLLKSILIELGIYQPRGTVADMEDEVIGMLARDPRRPLLIDEADLLISAADRACARYRQGVSGAGDADRRGTVPNQAGGDRGPLSRSRPGDEVCPAVDLDDCRTLARTLYPGLTISDALLEEARSAGEGRVRRVGNSLHAIAEVANRKALSTIDLPDFTSGSANFLAPASEAEGGCVMSLCFEPKIEAVYVPPVGQPQWWSLMMDHEMRGEAFSLDHIQPTARAASSLPFSSACWISWHHPLDRRRHREGPSALSRRAPAGTKPAVHPGRRSPAAVHHSAAGALERDAQSVLPRRLPAQ